MEDKRRASAEKLKDGEAKMFTAQQLRDAAIDSLALTVALGMAMPFFLVAAAPFFGWI